MLTIFRLSCEMMCCRIFRWVRLRTLRISVIVPKKTVRTRRKRLLERGMTPLTGLARPRSKS